MNEHANASAHIQAQIHTDANTFESKNIRTHTCNKAYTYEHTQTHTHKHELHDTHDTHTTHSLKPV